MQHTHSAAITLYTARTPNGQKVSIALEELGLPYELRALNLKALEQKEPWFLAINPNGRIPAIVDRDFPAAPAQPRNASDGAPVPQGLAVFESGAILLHLADKTGRLLPREPSARAHVLSWLMFQMGGVGPMQGQANVFFRYFPEKIPAAIERYQNETQRLYGVMDGALAAREFIGGSEYSIADIAIWPWVAQHEWSGVELEPFANLARWFAQVGERPAVKRGMEVPAGTRTPEKVVESARAMLGR
jgi:GSH-dependent disulfide-bond oxidoreductase